MQSLLMVIFLIGVGKTNNNGEITCYFNCPSVYSEVDNKNHKESFLTLTLYL